METLRQQALDYALGTLSKDDAILFEALLEEDDQAKAMLIEAQEECAALGATGVVGVHDTPPRRHVPRDYVDEADGAR